MPIVTRINGDPESIRRAARWLKSLAHASVVQGSHRVQDASAESVDAWQDAAADAFRERLDKGIAKVYELVEDASRLGEALTTYADSLAIARDHMEQARWLATNAGLVVTDKEIFEPGPATVETPRGTIDHTLGGNHEEMVDGFEQARIEAGVAESVLYSAWAYVRAIGHELVDGKKEYLAAGDFIAGWTGDVTERHRTALAGTADDLRAKGANARASYSRVLNLPTVDERLYREMALEADAVGRAAEYEQRVARALRIGRGVKLTGWAVVLAGVGYDVSQGKPITKAVFTGTVALGGSYAGEAVSGLVVRGVVIKLAQMGAGAALATSTAPEALVVVGAIAAGGVASYFGEQIYDELFPTQEQQIRDGDVLIRDDVSTQRDRSGNESPT